MKQFFSLLTVGLILVGFFFPLAWLAAPVTGLIAIFAAPAGKRPDGERWTGGGTLGNIWDEIVISSKMVECPYCKSKIMKDALKCAKCGEWVQGEKADPNMKVSAPPVYGEFVNLLMPVGILVAILLWIMS